MGKKVVVNKAKTQAKKNKQCDRCPEKMEWVKFGNKMTFWCKSCGYMCKT